MWIQGVTDCANTTSPTFLYEMLGCQWQVWLRLCNHEITNVTDWAIRCELHVWPTLQVRDHERYPLSHSGVNCWCAWLYKCKITDVTYWTAGSQVRLTVKIRGHEHTDWAVSVRIAGLTGCRNTRSRTLPTELIRCGLRVWPTAQIRDHERYRLNLCGVDCGFDRLYKYEIMDDGSTRSRTLKTEIFRRWLKVRDHGRYSLSCCGVNYMFDLLYKYEITDITHWAVAVWITCLTDCTSTRSQTLLTELLLCGLQVWPTVQVRDHRRYSLSCCGVNYMFDLLYKYEITDVTHWSIAVWITGLTDCTSTRSRTLLTELLRCGLQVWPTVQVRDHGRAEEEGDWRPGPFPHRCHDQSA